jgi:hypothetical protein
VEGVADDDAVERFDQRPQARPRRSNARRVVAASMAAIAMLLTV